MPFGRNSYIESYRKIPNPHDGKRANQRVTRDALWNGAFTDDEVCAEYFGGILASSRTEESKDDDAIEFVEQSSLSLTNSFVFITSSTTRSTNFS